MQKFENKKVLLLVPGHSLNEKQKDIEALIEKEHPVILAVNHIPHLPKTTQDVFVFFGNKRRYEKLKEECSFARILSSNVSSEDKDAYVVNYSDLIRIIPGVKYFDNSAVMALRLLKELNVESISIAGFDGFDDVLHIVRFLLGLQQLPDPGKTLFQAVLAVEADLVFPVGRHTVFRGVVHIPGADLNLKGDPFLTDHRCVQGLIHIRLRR